MYTPSTNASLNQLVECYAKCLQTPRPDPKDPSMAEHVKTIMYLMKIILLTDYSMIKRTNPSMSGNYFITNHSDIFSNLLEQAKSKVENSSLKEWTICLIMIKNREGNPISALPHETACHILNFSFAIHSNVYHTLTIVVPNWQKTCMREIEQQEIDQQIDALEQQRISNQNQNVGELSLSNLVGFVQTGIASIVEQFTS